MLQAVDREIEIEISAIKDGSHPCLLRNYEALQRAKDKKIAEADRIRKLQIKNIHQLYEYEVEDANALFNVLFNLFQYNPELI